MIYYLVVKQYPIDATLVGTLFLSHYIPYELFVDIPNKPIQLGLLYNYWFVYTFI